MLKVEGGDLVEILLPLDALYIVCFIRVDVTLMIKHKT